ncbi:PhnA domain-containing protein [Malaciobacter mytili]|uniref:PhnA domain protein n=1 Tax=Malaciobacter mytili LMG 24559 TaxID=1032238 RepID=A0AAX2AL23_9BACT|nr:alkylphosphonate utilization protein [Malaciobacter mytili]AXH13757.1 PhnA domain-containing protein [Malaciobacter mytili LMG 24559]RXK16366.1 PhnA domain protein [Malaciobacter mytili LMG 24559]
MSILEQLMNRSESSCELCKSTENLSVFEVSPSDGSVDKSILVCSTCKEQLEDESKIDVNHWHCLNDSMWSQEPAVQVVAYRMLNKIANEGWPQDLLDMMYLDDEVKAWANEGISTGNEVIQKDSNGVVLQAGDSVTLIKDLEVKGAGFTAKRGTVVKGISLTDNPEHIEGKINGIKIVLKTCFLKKV